MTQSTKNRLLLEAVDSRIIAVQKLLKSFAPSDTNLIRFYQEDLLGLQELRDELIDKRRVELLYN